MGKIKSMMKIQMLFHKAVDSIVLLQIGALFYTT